MTDKKKCPQCGIEINESHTRRIIDQSWCQQRGKYVRKREIEFCSPKCGSHYQMGCEG